MSYKKAIESREEEITNMQKQLVIARKLKDKNQVAEIERRIALVKSAIKELRKWLLPSTK